MKQDFGTTTTTLLSDQTTGDPGTQLAALIERLETAGGPDADIDWCINDALGRGHSDFSSYTASVDAALTLVPNSTYGITLSFHPRDEMQGYAYVASYSAVAATMPLALCVAALQARLALLRTPLSGSPPWEADSIEPQVNNAHGVVTSKPQESKP